MEMYLIAALGLAGLYMAWNIGANDLANAMGTVVGTGALSLRQVIVLAAIFEFLGAVFFGKRVTTTIAKGIVPIDLVGSIDPNLVVTGMLAAILASGLWVTLATFYNLPVSTSHATVGGVLGFGLSVAHLGIIPYSAINWPVMLRIVLSWFISPVMGGILGFSIFVLIRTLVLHRAEGDVEKYFVPLQVLTACYIAFAHGSNDVASAIGPISAAFTALGIIGEEIPDWIFVLGGTGIVLGLATWGYKVIETIGSKITELTPSRGFFRSVCNSLGGAPPQLHLPSDFHHAHPGRFGHRGRAGKGTFIRGFKCYLEDNIFMGSDCPRGSRNIGPYIPGA